MAPVKKVLITKSGTGCSPGKGANVGCGVTVQEKNLEGSSRASGQGKGQGQGRGGQNLSSSVWIRIPWRACPQCRLPGPTSLPPP